MPLLQAVADGGTSIEKPHLEFLEKVISELGFPMVVKKVYGSLGEGVYLVKNKQELKSLYSQIYRNPIIFQEYVPSSYGKSIRVMVIDGKVIGCFERYNKYDFRSNFGEKADGKLMEKPEKCIDFAQNVANILDIEYAGLDLLLDENNDPVLCEINSNAFFEEYEKVTGQNVAYEVAKMIKKKMCNE